MAFREDIECLKKVAPDEPIFVLRAQDKLAPALVALWSNLAQLTGCGQAKVEDARHLSDLMREWQRKTARAKFPD
jgi:hypothetical protein